MDEPVNEQVERPPAPVLRPYLESYTGYRMAGFAPGTHAGLPSRSLTMIVTFDAPLDLVGMPDPTQPGGRFVAMVGGLHHAPATIRHTGAQHGVQLALTPLGARALLGLPASALAGLVVPLDAVLPRTAELVERLSVADGWPARFSVLDDVLGRSLTDPRRPATEVLRAWTVLCAHRGAVTVADLAADTGWSRRHLSDRFRAEFGLTPKVAGRVLRFEASQELLRGSCPPPLAELAAVCGYADQAHLTREWRVLSGTTPGAWLAEGDFVPSEEVSEA